MRGICPRHSGVDVLKPTTAAASQFGARDVAFTKRIYEATALSYYAGKFEQFQSPHWRCICIPADYTNPGCHRVESIVRLCGESRPRSGSRGTTASLPGIEHSVHRDRILRLQSWIAEREFTVRSNDAWEKRERENYIEPFADITWERLPLFTKCERLLSFTKRDRNHFLYKER